MAISNHKHSNTLTCAGVPIKEATKVLIMLHGRGGSAQEILSLSNQLNVENFALIAPQADHNTWYHYSFMAIPEHNEPWLSSAIDIIKDTVDEVNDLGIANENIYFLGFSQGACLSLEFIARNAARYGGIAAFTGGLFGDKIYSDNYHGDFDGTPIFIGTGDPDSHVPLERVNETVGLLKSMNANVITKVYPNKAHSISQEEIKWANKLIFNT